MRRICIIGGHGKIALLLSRLLADAGHQVSSVVRNPDHRADVTETGATAVVADVENLDTAAIGEVLAGHDAVIWSAGAGGGNPERTYAVDRDAAIRTMDAATAQQVRRFVLVSYFGASLEHGVPESEPFHAYAQAKAEADAYLRDTDLDWTILGPSLLTLGEPTGAIELAPEATESGEVTRADVAGVAAAVLERPNTIGAFLQFNNGDTPISAALDRL